MQNKNTFQKQDKSNFNQKTYLQIDLFWIDFGPNFSKIINVNIYEIKITSMSIDSQNI